jgi:hypothetical protein
LEGEHTIDERDAAIAIDEIIKHLWQEGTIQKRQRRVRADMSTERMFPSLSILATFERKATFDTWVTQNHRFRQQRKWKWAKMGLGGVWVSV